MNEIRRWINACVLFESVKYVTLGGWTGGRIAVHRNPANLSTIRPLHLRLRGLVDGHDGSSYWWDSSLAIHSEMATGLGLDYRNCACLVLLRRVAPFTLIIYNDWRVVIASNSMRYLAADTMVEYAPNKPQLPFQQFMQQNEHST
jgi:hypothetical protein